MDRERIKATELATGLLRIVAPNPSPMTQNGTNTYIIGGSKGCCVIDPGPSISAHQDAILAAAGDMPIEAIVVTHAHLDHSPLARPLSQTTGAPVYAFGAATAGRSAIMRSLADDGLAGGGEGVDGGFQPDQSLPDGARLDGSGWALDVVHTPGHMGNHICLKWNDTLFSGDHVMGWASSLVSPPDGDLTDFMASCRRLQTADYTTFYPGHGNPVTNPQARLDWLIRHRLEREAAILTVLAEAGGEMKVPQITANVYRDVPPGLLRAAERNVFAHVVDLVGRGLISPVPRLSAVAGFTAR